MLHYRSLKFSVQFLSVVFSLLINTLLVNLIITKSPKKMGNYRCLMIYFCCSSILFSLTDVIVQPYIHTYEYAFFMITDIKSGRVDPKVMEVLICILCAFFAGTIYGIAIHFIYRYLALERKGRLHYFNHKLLPIWFSIPIIGGAIWYLLSIICFPQEAEKTEYIRATVKENFGLEMEETVYTGALFYIKDPNGTPIANIKSFIGFFGYLGIMQIPLNIIMVAGWKSYKKVRDLKDYGESEYSRRLQLQLYKALVAQTAIPIFLLFLPFGYLFICPIFGINCQILSAPCTFVYAIYPAIDPIPIIYFVDDYRKNVFAVCRHVNNRVGDSRNEDTSMQI